MMMSNTAGKQLRRTALASVTMMTLAAGGVQAQNRLDDLFRMPLEQLLQVEVLSTPKFSSDPARIPAAVDVLTAQDFRLFGWQTLSQALASLRGFTITDDHTYQYAGLRGISGAGDFRPRIQVLINGQRVNENIYDSVNVDQAFPLDIAQIRRIEIIRGPGAAVFGGNSMFGVINIITLNGASLDGARVTAGLGSGERRRAVLDWGRQDESGRDYRVSFSAFDEAGRGLYFPELGAEGLPATADGVGAEEGIKFSAQYAAGGLRASVLHSQRDKTVPTGSYGTILGDPAHVESDANILAELGYRIDLGEQQQLDNRIYYGAYRYRGYFPYDYEPDYVINFDDVDGRWWGLESRLRYQLSDRHTLTAGLEYRDDFLFHQINGDVGLGCVDAGLEGHCLDSRESRDQFALYLQDEIQLATDTFLTLGLRHDDIADQPDHLTPRLGLTHRDQRWGGFKYLYAEAFRNPNAYERFYAPVPWGYANPLLLPEYQYSHELTWERELAAHSALTVTLFHFTIDDFIGNDEDGIAINMGELRSRGLEFEYRREFAGQGRLRAGYSLMDTGFRNGARTVNVPRHSFKLNLALPLGPQGWHGAAEWQLASDRNTYMEGAHVAGYGIINLNVLYESADGGFNAAFGVRDLFDREYHDPVSADIFMAVPRDRIRQLGRSLQATLQWRL